MNPYGPRKSFNAIMRHGNNKLAVYMALLAIEALRKSALERNDCFCLSYSRMPFFFVCLIFCTAVMNMRDVTTYCSDSYMPTCLEIFALLFWS